MDNKEIILAIDSQTHSLKSATMDELQERLSALKTFRHAIEVRKEEITKPMREALASARDLFKPVEEKLKVADDAVRGQILQLQSKIDKSQAKLAKRVEEGSVSVEESMSMIVPDQKGLFREVSRLKIVSRSKIPNKYWILDEVSIRADLMKGKKVPGALIVKEKTVVSR